MNLAGLGGIRGVLPPTVRLPLDYFTSRGIFLDCLGRLVIDEGTHWGVGVRVLTRSHQIDGAELGPVVNRPVFVRHGAWIGSFATLYNCEIGEGAVVAAGSVVRSCEVAPNVMVAGNPARVIARRCGDQWHYLESKWRVLE